MSEEEILNGMEPYILQVAPELPAHTLVPLVQSNVTKKPAQVSFIFGNDTIMKRETTKNDPTVGTAASSTVTCATGMDPNDSASDSVERADPVSTSGMELETRFQAHRVLREALLTDLYHAYEAVVSEDEDVKLKDTKKPPL